MWVSGHSRSLKLVPFESSGAVSYSNYGAISYRLRDIATYRSKIATFLYHIWIQRPLRGWHRRNFAKMFETHKTRMIGLPCGEEIMTIRWAVSIEYRNVTDRQTYRRTDRQTELLYRYRASVIKGGLCPGVWRYARQHGSWGYVSDIL